MNTLKIKVVDTRIMRTRYDESEVEDGWIVVEDYPQGLIYDPFNWFYIDGQFIKEDPEDIRKREEEEREEYERTRPKTTEEKVDELTAITDDMILLMAELIGG